MAQGELIFSVSYVGDLVTATSVLPLLDPAVTGRTMAAAPAAASLLASDPRLSSVAVVNSSHALGWRLETWRLLRHARRLNSAVLNLEVYPPRWRFVVRVARLLRLPARHLDLPALLADNRRSALGQATAFAHRSDYYAQAVGAQPPAPPARLPADSRLGEEARLRLLGEGRRPYIVFHPGSSDPARRPPLELLAALGANLADEGGRAVLAGTPTESGLTRELLDRLPPQAQAVDACGLLDIRELAALTSQAALFIGGDSGPLKIAEAVGTRTLSFWHAGQPSAAFAGPRGLGHAMLPASASAEEALAAARRLLAR